MLTWKAEEGATANGCEQKWRLPSHLLGETQPADTLTSAQGGSWWTYSVYQSDDKFVFFEAVKVVASCHISNRKLMQVVSQIWFLFCLILTQGYVY